MKRTSTTQKEKEDHYRDWLLRKKLYESARTLLLNKISKERAQEEERWIEVGEACATVDLAGGACNTYDVFMKGAEKEYQNAKRLNKSLKFDEFWSSTNNSRFTSLGSSFLVYTSISRVSKVHRVRMLSRHVCFPYHHNHVSWTVQRQHFK